jgi:D-glycero-beta-D-manno-heptose 1-phosphate adenylyltransferase
LSAPSFLAKIATRSEALARMAALPKPVVFTNGVFDVLHRGHASYLAAARALGGSLVVALNTDASARRLGKGPDRPLNNEQDRAALMAALESVSLVTWFDEDTPFEIIDVLRPERSALGRKLRWASLCAEFCRWLFHLSTGAKDPRWRVKLPP